MGSLLSDFHGCDGRGLGGAANAWRLREPSLRNSTREGSDEESRLLDGDAMLASIRQVDSGEVGK
jgi:hypothetical protein